MNPPLLWSDYFLVFCHPDWAGSHIFASPRNNTSSEALDLVATVVGLVLPSGVPYSFPEVELTVSLAFNYLVLRRVIYEDGGLLKRIAMSTKEIDQEARAAYVRVANSILPMTTTVSPQGESVLSGPKEAALPAPNMQPQQAIEKPLEGACYLCGRWRIVLLSVCADCSRRHLFPDA